MSQCLSKETSLLQNTPEEIFTYKFYGQSNNLMDCSFEEGIENLRPLIEYNSDGEINENLLSAVTQAICKRTEEIKGYTDNYYSCLIRHIRSSITISILHHIDRQNITVIIEFFTSFLSIAMLTASPAAAPISTPPTPVVAVPAAVPAVAAAAFAVSLAACVR